MSSILDASTGHFPLGTDPPLLPMVPTEAMFQFQGSMLMGTIDNNERTLGT